MEEGPCLNSSSSDKGPPRGFAAAAGAQANTTHNNTSPHCATLLPTPKTKHLFCSIRFLPLRASSISLCFTRSSRALSTPHVALITNMYASLVYTPPTCLRQALFF